MQGPQGKLPAVVLSVLGVRISPSTALNQSDWAAWPLSPAQAHYTMQAAWLHAHLLHRLAPRLGWQSPALAACVAAADGSAPSSSGSGDAAAPTTGGAADGNVGVRGGSDGVGGGEGVAVPAAGGGLRGTSSPVDTVATPT